MSSLDDRNARLDALIAATNSWAEQAQANINQRVATCRLILQGRTGSDSLAQSAVSATTDVVVDEIDQFLST